MGALQIAGNWTFRPFVSSPHGPVSLKHDGTDWTDGTTYNR